MIKQLEEEKTSKQLPDEFDVQTFTINLRYSRYLTCNYFLICFMLNPLNINNCAISLFCRVILVLGNS